MPLPSPVPREEIHCRRIEMRGYRRTDGLYDIEGRVVDTKPFDFHRRGATVPVSAGIALHDLWVRMVVDERFVVRDVIAVSDATPFAVCREAAPTLSALIGAQIKPGWSALVKERLGGSQSCTHLMELMLPLATAAYQALVAVRRGQAEPLGRDQRPAKIDSCYAYASHRPIVQRLWPEHYSGR